jgi:hypothetical protein
MEVSSHVGYLPTGRQREDHFLNLFYGTDGGLSRKVREIKGIDKFL